MSSQKTKLHARSRKCKVILKRSICQANCMDSKPTGVGPTSAVKVFTVFVLSGSLFLLIYNVGRRRKNMNSAHSHSVREPHAPVIANPSTLRGYFSHYKDKPLPHHRKPSLTAVLDTFPSGTSISVEGNPTPRSDHTDPDAGAVPDAPATELLDSDPIATPGGSSSRSYDPDTGPYMVARRYNWVSQPSNATYLDPNNLTTGHEGQMIEHMRRRSTFGESRGSTEGRDKWSGVQERRASSSLGDMSQLEKSFLGTVMEDTQNNIDLSPRVSTDTDAHSDDPDWPRSSSPQRVSTMPPKQFLKPLIYILIWSVLSYSVDVYGSTGWGAKMDGFPAPFLKATVRFLTQAIMSSCMLRWPGSNVFVVPWNSYMFIVAPIATAAVLDHDLRNPSVFTVTLGVPISNNPVGILEHAYTMISSVKDATLETVWDPRMQSRGFMPLSVFLFALAFRLESRSLPIAVSIAVIAVGFIFGVSTGNKFWVLSLKDSSFGPLLSGLRWAAIQGLLQKRELGIVTPVVTMRALSPSMAMVAAIISLVSEPWSSLLTTEYFDDPDKALKSCGHIMIGALLGTAMALAELVVVYHTSALTLIILGMLKDLCVVVPRMIHDNHFSEQNMLGLTIFTIGLFSLVILKYQRRMKRSRLDGPVDDSHSLASGASTDRWSEIRAWDFSSVVSPFQRFRGSLEGAYGACAGVPRRLRASWREYRERRNQR